MHAPYKTLEIASWLRKSRSKPIDEIAARVQDQRLQSESGASGKTLSNMAFRPRPSSCLTKTPSEYQHRRLTWKRELGPLGDLGDYLAEQLVTISWQLDRANFHERARLAHQISKVPKDKARAKTRRIDRLMVDLLHEQPEDNHPGPTWSYGANHGTKQRTGGSRVIPDPAVLIAKLEASLAGCRRLLAEWTKIRDEFQPWFELDVVPSWGIVAREPMVRMLGYRADQVEGFAKLEPKLAVVVNALEFVSDRVAAAFYAQQAAMDDDDDVNFDDDPLGIDHSKAPAESPGPTPAQHKAGLRAIIDEEITRLSELVAQFEAEADETDDEHEGDEQDQLAFDDSPEGDRLHRYQAHWSRSLLRTIEAIARLKKRGDGGEQGHAGGEPDEPPMQVPPLMDSAPSKPDSTHGAMQRGPNPSLALRAHDPSKPDSTRGAMQQEGKIGILPHEMVVLTGTPEGNRLQEGEIGILPHEVVVLTGTPEGNRLQEGEIGILPHEMVVLTGTPEGNRQQEGKIGILPHEVVDRTGLLKAIAYRKARLESCPTKGKPNCVQRSGTPSEPQAQAPGLPRSQRQPVRRLSQV